MSDKFFISILFGLSLLFAPQIAKAQFSPGKKEGNTTSVEYNKMKDDTLRVRKSKMEPKKKRGKAKSAVGDSLKVKNKQKKKSVKAAPKKQSKSKVQKIDSIGFEKDPYRLGDRIIMRGDSGADVRAVARILVKKLYMDEDSIIYTQTGDVIYDGELVRAVMRFQKLNGLYEDGIVGFKLIKMLRKRK